MLPENTNHVNFINFYIRTANKQKLAELDSLTALYQQFDNEKKVASLKGDSTNHEALRKIAKDQLTHLATELCPPDIHRVNKLWTAGRKVALYSDFRKPSFRLLLATINHRFLYLITYFPLLFCRIRRIWG